jgi:subfamily B ATP-binding cassette protein MsbA
MVSQVNLHRDDKESWRRLFSYFSPYKLNITITFFALVVFSLVDAGMIYFVKPLIDEGFSSSDGKILQLGSIIVLAVFLIRGIASFIYNYVISYTSTKITQTIRQEAFDKLQSLPMAYFDKHNKGVLISKLIYDTEQISGATSKALVTLFRESLIVIVLLGLLFYSSWKLSLIFLIIGPTIGLIISVVTKRFKKVSLALQQTMGDVTRATEQSLVNHQEVLSFNMAESVSKEFSSINNKNRQQAMKLASASAFSNPVIQLIASIAISLVLLLASNSQILEELTAGTFAMVLFAIAAMLKPLKQLTTINQQLQKGIIAARSIFNLLDEKDEEDNGTIIFQGDKYQIEFDRLSFNYPNSDKQVLKNFSAKIPANKSIALVGETGSGKSTLASLILRLYQAEKNSLFINGKAIEEFSLASLRSKISFVSQSVVLFDDTLANNIMFGCKRKVSISELEQVAKEANVFEFAQRLELGLNTPVGENGCLLSGGQRQRIAIARAMLKDAPIIILDEATSALDNRSEYLIQQAFTRLGKNKTMIIIAHRLSTIENVDMIFVLEKGQLIESGDHLSLLEQKGAYYEMHQQQFIQQGT